jgi:2-methylcitrate dehydratase PrpD
LLRRVNVATATGLTARLASRAASLRLQELPEDILELARQAVIDWFGVTLGGCGEDGPLMLLETLPACDPRDSRTATVVGHGVRLATRDAALVNGTASHRLDFDDVNMRLPGHASVAVLGAALALGEQRDASGAELIVAFVAGYETACRVALAVGEQPYALGFHATGTIGTFGAAAACARLLELDAAATAVAFGIAASEAAGLKCNLGTMTKSLHAGKACENGLLAAELAARGFTAQTSAIEAEQGFAAISGGGCDAAAALADPPGGWFLRENLFKHHAACFFTHSAIEGVRELRDTHDLSAEQLEGMTLHVSEVELGACAIPEPATGLEVKFSIAHLAAMALLDRDTAAIVDADAGDEQVIAVRRRIVLAADGTAGQPTRVEAELRDGSLVEACRDVNTPGSDLAAQRLRLEQKFASLASPVLGTAGAAELLSRLGALEQSSVRALMAAATRST